MGGGAGEQKRDGFAMAERLRNQPPEQPRRRFSYPDLMSTLEPGSRLGPYSIVELCGKGGMGEVYRAHDTRLERDVAIKVLAERLSDDGEFGRRFEREAKTISQLQHPHVCTLFDIGSDEGRDYLVMELLEGETLEDWLKRGALGLEEVLKIGTQIAEAIEAAHRRNLVHRDLKRGNVMLTPSSAKVLDFGLAKGTAAKAIHGQGIDGGPVTSDTQTPTATQALTSDGSILGTLHYMAPEQLEGKVADVRDCAWRLRSRSRSSRAEAADSCRRRGSCWVGIRMCTCWSRMEGSCPTAVSGTCCGWMGRL